MFSAFLNWTVTARTMLPLVPAAAILVSRFLDRPDHSGKSSTVQRALVIIPTAIVALVVTTADYLQANAVRRSVETIVENHRDEKDRLLFTGHWGFQYYMMRHGIESMEISRTAFKPGDLLAVPVIAARANLPPEDIAPRSYEVLAPKLKWAATMSHHVGAGFYASNFGPLPYVFGKVAPESVGVYEFKYHISPQRETVTD